MDKEDWEYKTTFLVDAKVLRRGHHEMVFKGLDTYAKIYLNDSLLLETDNMFRTYPVDVSQRLKAGENHLRVLLESPIHRGIEKYDSVPYVIPVSDNDLAEIGEVPENKKVSIYTRKAGYHFGWDWGPRLVTSGIWRPVVLKSWDDFRIKDLHIQQKSLDSLALLTARIAVEALEATELDMVLTVDGKVLSETPLLVQAGTDHYDIPLSIRDPELWWPNGFGKQKRYTVAVQLKGRKSQDRASHRIGLRTIELVTEKDSIGSSFYFKVNGQPIFMKGANYIPNDVFLTRVDSSAYTKVVDAAVAANMNMLRVWGGGIYEDDLFYELCDEKGILVWQDFMFACAMFPGDPAFLENVRQEAIDNVKRLRNHPSIALWCGNNEILAAWKNWGWENEMIQTYGKAAADDVYAAYEAIFHEVLPGVVETYDASRPYWASSPSSAEGVPESLTDGDRHYWGVWWGKEPFANFEKEMPRFMSEFGFQSFPELSTVEKYTLPEDHDIYSEVMESHQRSSIGNVTIEEYMLRHYQQPKDFAAYLYVSHLLQAYGIGEGINAHRRNRERCMGSLYWQINDCWPVASWSSIDYYGKWKALHYEVQRAFEPVALNFTANPERTVLYVLNDRLEPVSGRLTLELLDFEGTQLETWKEQITVPPGSSQKAFTFRAEAFSGYDPSKTVLWAKLHLQDSLVAEKIRYLSPFKELKLPNPELHYEIREKETTFEVTFTTQRLAKDIYLASSGSGNFSDNYFDLLPGQSKTVTIEKDSTLSNFEEDLRVITLKDSY
ncbi:MAG: glycoside hydrolase family 2 protein [Bacteroidota bacterium]